MGGTRWARADAVPSCNGEAGEDQGGGGGLCTLAPRRALEQPAKIKGAEAVRASIASDGHGHEMVARVLERAAELGLLGWVRDDPDGQVRIHAEGAAGAPAQ